MSSMTIETFLAGVDDIAACTPAYRLGGDGSDGTCDCIGLIIGAIRRSGGKWTGIHGSNYAARNAMTELRPVSSTAALKPGMLVFKAKAPGHEGYALPSRYQDNPDQNDYYHVGVVRSSQPLRIIHCTSPGGIQEDAAPGRWAWCGWLRLIQNDEAPQPAGQQTASVTAPAGRTVNLRDAPGGALLARIPIGTQAAILAWKDDWRQISCCGLTGWMKAQYLLTAQQSGCTADLSSRIAALEERLDQLASRLTALDGDLADE